METACYAVISRGEEFAHLRSSIITPVSDGRACGTSPVRGRRRSAARVGRSSPALAAAAAGGDMGNPEKQHFS